MSTSAQSIGQYRIERELGEGSFLAAESNGRRVVLKMLEGDCLLKGQLHPMIKDRLGRVRELAHLGVANLQGAERDGERAFLVWEFVEGITLEQYLFEYEPERARLVEMAWQLLMHVEALHALGIVHGGIHWRNVIVRPEGGVMLTHVSPLLYQEERVDVEAVREVMGEMGFEVGEATSLKEMAEVIRPREETEGTHSEPESEHLGRWALIGAIVAALVGAGVAWMIWKNAEREPREPTARATEYSCPCHPLIAHNGTAMSTLPWHPGTSDPGDWRTL
jgi:hypothetical protein